MAAFTSNIDITSGGTYGMNITNGMPASQVANDLNGKFANIQRYLQNGLPEVWTGDTLPDSLPDGKIIINKNELYSIFGNNIYQIPNITNSSQIVVTTGLYTIYATQSVREDAKTIRYDVTNNFTKTYTNVLLYTYYVQEAILTTDETWFASGTSYNANINFSTSATLPSSHSLFAITVAARTYSQPTYNIKQHIIDFQVHNSNPITLSFLPDLFANSSQNVFTANSSSSLSISYKYYIFQYIA